MPKKNNIRKQLGFIDVFRSESNFLIFILLLFVVAALLYNIPSMAMWFGFAVAGYSVVSNDSIQTIGTFLASNAHRKWWVLWLYIGGLFVGTIAVSYFLFDGDISFRRLATKGFNENPVSFEFLQIAAPILLIIITRMRMPISTTFLLLSSFAASSGAIGKVLSKSLGGYFIAFALSIVIYLLLAKYFKRTFKGKAHSGWVVAQWITSGALWCLWIMQDAANIAVFLPRQLELGQLVAVALIVFVGLGVIFYNKGGRIQQIVTTKTDITDVRPATVVDLIYSLLMAFHLVYSTVPMSTTWVFLGLLGGREVAMHLTKTNHKSLQKTLLIIGRDILLAIIGLIISIIIAYAVNPQVRLEVNAWFM
ncbi:MAG: hypothetical protein RBT74_00075 [Tenuifilaceae bacterium]|jgi:hypothetical protein|nr:hypothetical protein [Tenuifilaceae bacterium]